MIFVMLKLVLSILLSRAFAQVVPVDVGPPFPYSTGFLTNTNSAQQNFKTGCATACDKDILTFSTCGGDVAQDTYLRLFLGDVQVAQNDDACNSASLLQYLVTSPGCNTYCLHMGCFGLSMCDMNVTGTTLSTATLPPTVRPTEFPTSQPSKYPTSMPTSVPLAGRPTSQPTNQPSSAPSGVPITMTVLNVTDGQPDPAACYPMGTSACNLRSAWMACTQIPSYSTCYISLPSDTELFLNSVDIGGLVLDASADIVIDGHGAVVNGQVGQVPDAVPAGGDFPVYTGEITNSYSATVNYSVACTEACFGNTVTFSACDADRNQDTYFRLYSGDTFLAENDDACTAASSIQYTVNTPGCSQLCLHMGCFATTPCIVNATATIVSSTISPRFVYFQQNGTSTGNEIPRLKVDNVTLQGFGGGAFNGGAIYLNGEGDFQLTNSRFVQNIGAFGGCVYVSTNSKPVIIDNCEFRNSTGTYGGGIYINNFVSSFLLSNSYVASCVAMTAGGGVYFASNNFNARIEHSEFRSCRAVGITSSTGGAVTIDVANNNFLVLDTLFDECYSNWYGGCFALLRENVNVSFVRSTFISSLAGYGGALFIGDQNVDVQLVDSAITNCTAFIGSGGGVYVYTSNINITVQNTTVSQCRSINRGGGMFMFQYNDYLKIIDSVFDTCSTTSIGGGFECMYNNNGLEFTNTVFSNCYSAGSAGAINMDGSNNDLAVTNCTFSSCTSELFGGAIRLVSGHINTQIRQSVFDNCSSLQGGALQFEQANINVTISDCKITNTRAVINGGAIALNSSNTNFVIAHTFIAATSSGVTGGAITVWNANNQFKFLNSTIQNATSKSGGGIYFQSNNNNFLLESSVLDSCTATLDFGGGLWIYESNNYGSVVNASISNCVAKTDGGGLASYSGNIGMVVAGTAFNNNTASKNGGGIWSGDANTELVIIDYTGYKETALLQSNHPYSSGYPTGSVPFPIFEQFVSVPGATSFVINFDENTAISPKDTLNIYTNASMTELLFTSHGIGWPGVTVPSLIVTGSSFFLAFTGANSFDIDPTTAEAGYFGFKCSAFPVMASTTDSGTSDHGIFFGNEAMSGGGVYMYSNSPFPVIVSTDFIGNYAQTGGALFLRNGIDGLTLVSSSFTRNGALFDGGAMVVYTTNYGYLVIDCPFLSNSAGRDGGALLLLTGNGVGSLLSGNEILFQRCVISNNAAVSFGGGIYGSADNVMILDACSVYDNTVTSGAGGGIYAYQHNNISLLNSMVTSNSAAYAGGAMCLNLNNFLYITNANISNNEAGSIGGGLSLLGDSEAFFYGASHLHANSASFAGGGIALSNSPLFTLATNGSLMIMDNTADRGSAIFIDGVTPGGEAFHDLIIADNVARIGGTVFWLFDTTMSEEPAGIGSDSITWMGNIAPYADKVGTQATSIIGPSSYDVTVYNTALSPALTFQLYDYYGQLLNLDGSTTISARINASSVNCSGQSALLAGSNLYGSGVPVQNTTAVFADLEAYCSPEGSVEVIFESTNVNGVAASYVIHNSTVLSFRSCVAGEKYTVRQCEECPLGSFSLQANAQTCTDCLSMSGVKECYGNQLDLDRGYWRRYPTNEEVMACVSDIGCQGGNLTGNGLCAIGYAGPLCSVCADGYFSVSGLCVSCAGDLMTPTLIAYICVFVFLLVMAMAIYYIYFRFFRRHFQSEFDGRYSYSDRATATAADGRFSRAASLHILPDDEPIPPLVKLCVAWLKKNFSQLSSQLKIIVSTYQVITAASTVLDVTMPASFTNFADVADFLNLNISGALPFACNGNYNFVDHMFLATLMPMCIGGVIMIAFLVAWAKARFRIQSNPNRRRGAKRRKFNQLRNQYFKYFLYLAYMVLPSVTTIIFQMFPCVNIDPAHEDSGVPDLYLRADMSISCTSNTYYRGVAYAVLMILIYPVGIPGLYLYLLYNRRYLIMSRSVALLSGRDKGGAEAEDKSKEKKKESKKKNNIGVDTMDPDDDDEGAGEGAGVDEEVDEADPDDVVENAEALRESMGAGSPWAATVAAAAHGMNPRAIDPSFMNVSTSPNRSTTPDRGATTIITRSTSSGGEVGIHPDIAFISFLWISYRPEFWYWELIETFRRLMLTAFLSIIVPGQSPQSLVAVLLAMIFSKLYDHFKPYVRQYNNTLADIGNMQIFLTFYGILAIQQRMLDDTGINWLGYALIMVNLSVIFVTIFKVVSRSFGKVLIIQEDLQTQRETMLINRMSTHLAEASNVNGTGVDGDGGGDRGGNGGDDGIGITRTNECGSISGDSGDVESIGLEMKSVKKHSSHGSCPKTPGGGASGVADGTVVLSEDTHNVMHMHAAASDPAAPDIADVTVE